MFINAVGKACPIPVVMAKKELDGGCTDLVVAVDNAIAVQNLTRLASGRGLNVSSEEQDGGFHVHISGTGAPAAEGTASPPGRTPRFWRASKLWPGGALTSWCAVPV